MCGRGAASDLTKRIEEDVARIKANKPWEVEYMHWDEMIEESRAEGREEGRAEGRKEGSEYRGYDAVDRVIADGKYNEDEACKLLKVDYEAYKAYRSAAAGAEDGR